MGDYIYQIDSSFVIKRENIKKAWDALIKLFKIKEKSNSHYSYIFTDDVLNANSFEDAMSEARWELYLDDNGNVNEIYFNGKNYGGDEEIILGSIAPFVENGSYITMQREDGERWKWKFDCGDVHEVYGHFVFDDEVD